MQSVTDVIMSIGQVALACVGIAAAVLMVSGCIQLTREVWREILRRDNG